MLRLLGEGNGMMQHGEPPKEDVTQPALHH